MARDPRRTARPGAGPGRSKRPRPVSRPAKPPREEVETKTAARSFAVPAFAHGMHLTKRALILIVVLMLLVLSWARSITIYYGLQQQLVTKRASIAEKQAKIDSLEDQIKRWEDPNYVRAQARDRLGWVMPGETGYVVIGADGRPIPGSSSVAGGSASAPQRGVAWWEKVGTSVVTADQPMAAPVTGAQPAPTKTGR